MVEYKNVRFFVAVLILACGFFNNQWGTVDKNSFDVYQRDSDALVYGGAAHCVAEGIAPLGLWAGSNSADGFSNPGWVETTRATLLNGEQPATWLPYTSQIGLQGWSACLLYKISGSASPERLMLGLRALNALLLAVFAGIIIRWSNSLGKDIGMAIPVTLLLFSPWLTQIGASVYWLSWTWFLPLVLAIFFTRKSAYPGLPASAQYALLALAVFLKSACGYEFISFVLLAMLLPYLEKFLRTGPSRFAFWPGLAWPGLAGLAGFLSAIVAHAMLRSPNFNIGEGAQAIFADAARRMSSLAHDGSSLSADLQNSLRVPLGRVVDAYLNCSIVALPAAVEIKALHVVLAILAAWLALAVRTAYAGRGAVRCGIFALGVLATASILAPMSWFVLAKGHSYIHQSINPVLWILPALPLAVTFVGTVAHDLFPRSVPRRWRQSVMLLGLLALIAGRSGDLDLYLQLRQQQGNAHVFDNARVMVLRNTDELVFVFKEADRFDWNTKFFVHVVPKDAATLPVERRQYGFDNLDFSPTEQRQASPRWSVFADYLIFRKKTPSSYAPLRINFGQYRTDTGEQLWLGEIHG